MGRGEGRGERYMQEEEGCLGKETDGHGGEKGKGQNLRCLMT